MVKKSEIELEYLHYLQALRELSEFYIKSEDYDYFSELFSIQAGELMNCLSNEHYNKKYQFEIDFFFKYSGYDETNFLNHFSSINGKFLEDESDEYFPSDWIDKEKFLSSFTRDYNKVKNGRN